MKKYDIKGMSCAACSKRVEDAVLKVSGVSLCEVNLLTNSMKVDGSYNEDDIIKAVENAGYGISKENISSKEEKSKDSETLIIKKRLVWSAGLLVILMYFSMGHMLNIPLPKYFSHNPIALGITQLLISAVIMVINQRFFISGFKSLFKGYPNMDTLVSLGSLAGFLYSVYAIFEMSALYVEGDVLSAHHYLEEFYFESSAMILTLVTVGKMLEAHSKGKTTDALKGLMSLAPENANIIVDGKEKKVPIEEVKKGDIFIVRSGESIPVDGVVIKGDGAVNEAALTGESIPKEKTAGDRVWAATVNTTGYIECEALMVGEDTTLSKIIKMVSDAAATKAPIAKIADKVSGFFVPVVIILAVLTTLIWLFMDKTTGFAIARGISVLVISCPCALGLATPVAIMVGTGVGAKGGILFKNAESLENTGRIKNVVLDKTGTITKGTPEVTGFLTSDNFSDKELLKLAYSLEIKSEHPLARAIIKKAEKNNILPYESENFKTHSGHGLCAKIKGKTLYGGNLSFIMEKGTVKDEIIKKAEEFAKEGKTPLFFLYEDEFAGVILVKDTIKDDSADAIKELKDMGIYVVMLTGDNENTANAIGKEAGVCKIISGVLPDGKEKIIRELSEKGKTAMVGDGINDAPALTRADIGIAIGGGADIAIDAADVVLVSGKLSDVVKAIRLSRLTLKNIKQNLFWAFIYNITGIPLAAGAFIGIFGWELNPMFAAAAMSLSSVSVVTNALRLNLYDVKKNKHHKKEKKTMEKVLKVEGMMCPHCEARVKKLLEEIDFVLYANPSHEKGTVEITFAKEPDMERVKKVVEDAGYNIVS